MKKIATPDGIREEEMTATEIAELEAENSQRETEIAEAEAKATELANTKASAKSKLMAGEPLTEAEADTLIL